MQPLRYLSLFSGLEAATLAWKPLGWQCVGVAEIEAFPRSLLAHRLPGVPNLGDVTQITEAQIAALGHIDVLVFGSPCQDLSRGGARRGLAGERSHLFFDAMRIVQWARKHCGLRWALWENVRGAFTSNDGHDFAAVVQCMADLPEPPAIPPHGWGNEGVAVGGNLVEWATLDSQWFGVPQRRRRVFCLLDFGDWRSRPPVLLERDGLRGDRPPQRRCDGLAAACAARSAGACECVSCGTWWDGGQVSQTLDAVLHKGQMMPEKNRFPVVMVPASPARGSTCSSPTSCPSATAAASPSAPSATTTTQTAHTPAPCRTQPTNIAPATPGTCKPVFANFRARKVTPIEAERLFGIPDNYTLIPHNGKPAADLPRYKALGNTMAVPVMRWIGTSIDFVHNY